MAKLTKTSYIKGLSALTGRKDDNLKIAAKHADVEKGHDDFTVKQNAETRVRYISKFLTAAENHAAMLAKAGVKPEQFANVPRNVAEKKIPYILDSIAAGAPLKPEAEKGDKGYCNTLGMLLNSAKYTKEGTFKVSCAQLKKELGMRGMTQPSEVLKTCLFLTTGYDKQLDTKAEYKIPVIGILEQFQKLYA